LLARKRDVSKGIERCLTAWVETPTKVAVRASATTMHYTFGHISSAYKQLALSLPNMTLPGRFSAYFREWRDLLRDLRSGTANVAFGLGR
jgi:hypothetical protein